MNCLHRELNHALRGHPKHVLPDPRRDWSKAEPGGLDAVIGGLEMLKGGKVSGKKLVVPFD